MPPDASVRTAAATTATPWAKPMRLKWSLAERSIPSPMRAVAPCSSLSAPGPGGFRWRLPWAFGFSHALHLRISGIRLWHLDCDLLHAYCLDAMKTERKKWRLKGLGGSPIHQASFATPCTPRRWLLRIRPFLTTDTLLVFIAPPKFMTVSFVGYAIDCDCISCGDFRMCGWVTHRVGSLSKCTLS